MAGIPDTSITLLKALAGDCMSGRWAEFCRVYEEPMRGFLRVNYPTVEPEDVIQETLLVLVKKLPNYTYTPDEHGHFRCYLMGILKHKAVDALRKRIRGDKIKDAIRQSPVADYHPVEDDSWKQAVLETAIAQLLKDATIPSRNRAIFEAVAVNHESPASVAERYKIDRNNVDQIKARMMKRLSAFVQQLTSEL